MQKISDLNIKLRTKGEKRREIFDYFFDRLYPDWLKFKKKKDSESNKKTFQKFLGIKFGRISTEDMIGLKGICLDAEKHGSNFAKVFYGRFKIKK